MPTIFMKSSHGTVRRKQAGRLRPLRLEPPPRLSVPRWLLILLLGIGLGAGGLSYVERNVLPPRLSPGESQALQSRATALETERARLQGEIGRSDAEARTAAQAAAREIASMRAENEKLSADLAAARESVAPLERDVALFTAILPPDPRGGAVAVRAARFANDAGKLDYHVLLTRDAEDGNAFEGVMELVMTGTRGGRDATVTLDPVPVSLERHRHLQGELALPPGFDGRQVTVRVLDRAEGRLMGMRVYYVR
jgi:hypothetical protein